MSLSRKLNNRDKYLRRVYGITLQQYNDLLTSQEGCCAVCGKHNSEEKRSLHVDHNHLTAEIRGLLCSYCNLRVIGRHRNPELFRKAAEYLAQGTGWFVPLRKRKRRRKRR